MSRVVHLFFPLLGGQNGTDDHATPWTGDSDAGDRMSLPLLTPIPRFLFVFPGPGHAAGVGASAAWARPPRMHGPSASRTGEGKSVRLGRRTVNSSLHQSSGFLHSDGRQHALLDLAPIPATLHAVVRFARFFSIIIPNNSVRCFRNAGLTLRTETSYGLASLVCFPLSLKEKSWCFLC